MFALFALGLTASAATPDYPLADVLADDPAAILADVRDALATASETGDPACLTPVVARARANADRFTPAQWRELRDLLALPEPVPAEDVAPADTCWASEFPNTLESDHFHLEWEDGAFSESMAQNFLDSLEESWSTEIDELGWKAPTSTDTYKLMVFVPDESRYAGAYTTVDNCEGSWMPYIVAYSGSFSYGSWYKTMASHEFNHASQFAYGFAHEFWWWEATATYAEEYVYPSYNDWSDMVSYYASIPYIGMNASAGNSNNSELFYHTYAMAIWAFYLDQHVGGHDLVRGTWEYSEGEHGQYNLWMPDVIDGIELDGQTFDFDEVYEGFLAAAAVMDFDERNGYRTPNRVDTVRELPATGVEDDTDPPQSLGQAFIKFDGDLAEDGMELKVSFQGDPAADGWYAVLVRGDTSVEEMVPIPLDENYAGEATIPFEGGADLHLVVSPVLEDAQGYNYSWTRADEFTYSWEAEVFDPNAVPEDTGVAPPSAGDGEPKACGCATGGGAAGLAWLAGLAALAVRRRR